MLWKAGLTVVLLLGITPPAAGAGNGEFIWSDQVVVDAPSEVHLEMRRATLDWFNLQHLFVADGVFEKARIRYYDMEAIATDGISVQAKPRALVGEQTFENGSLHVASDPTRPKESLFDGVTIRTGSEGILQAALTKPLAIILEPPPATNVSGRFDSNTYTQDISSDFPFPVLYGTVSDRSTLSGNFSVQAAGPNFTFNTSQSSVHYPTGRVKDANNPIWSHFYTIEILFEGLVLNISAAPWEVVGRAATFTTESGVGFPAVSGYLETGEARFEVRERQDVRLDGLIGATILPAQSSKGTIQVSGDIRSTNLQPMYRVAAQTAPAAAPVASWGMPLAAVALAAGGMGAAAIVRQRRGPPPTFTADECARFALDAQDRAEWGRALEWLDMACKLAPRSGGIVAARAFVLEQMGAWDDARQAYDRAAVLDPNGEADFAAARMAAFAGMAPEETVERLRRAFAVAPSWAEEVDAVPVFAALYEMPGFDEFVTEAMSRADG